MRTRLVAAVAVVMVVAFAPASARAHHACPGGGPLVPPALAWQGAFEDAPVSWTTANGTRYTGTIFRPVSLGNEARRPGIVLIHGYAGIDCDLWWAARALAGHGYVALTVNAASRYGNAASYAVSLAAAVTFFVSAANPYANLLDASRIGLVGFSMGARAASYDQGIDPRVSAVVAFDNLGSDLTGDQGTAIDCDVYPTGRTTAPQAPVRPRVPALGEASDLPCYRSPGNLDPEQKKSGYRVWHDAGLPSMEVVFRGTDHFDWGVRSPLPGSASERNIRRFFHFAHAWFDRWLRGDLSAAARLFPESVDGTPIADVLSARFRSAAFVDGVDCEDLAVCLAP